MRISAIQLIGQFPVRQSVSKYGRGTQNTDSFDVDTFVSFGVQRVYPKEAPAMVCLEKVKSRGGIVPKRVEDLVREYAKDEALKDLTLTEVHKIAYADLKKCKTLTEAKKLFPEFECVKHLDELSAKELAELKRVGFEITSDNTHYKLVYKGSKYWFSLAKTTSDKNHSGKNLTSDITKTLSIYK